MTTRSRQASRAGPWPTGDILRIEVITSRGVMVRRLLEPDRTTGQRRFTSQVFHYAGCQSSDLAYAITGHSAQGATVHTGIAVVTGNEDRQWLYPAMTRGTDANLVFVVTAPGCPADQASGVRRAPGLGRFQRIRRDRQGFPAARPAAGPGGPEPREPIAVLADVLGRDGAELSATQTRHRNLANADHLAVLHAIWSAETQDARHDRYRELVTAALPPGHRGELSHQARWLFRTLRAAELAGLDPAEVTRTAIASRDLAGTRDIAAVLDARIRPRVYPLLPEPPGPWTSRVPQLPDPTRQAYLTGIAVQMDDRTRRLGQHTAQTAPAWATNALGPVPPGPAARRTWEHKAASIAAYREMYSYGHPRDPIGPEPSRETPDQRAAWHEAFLALGPVDADQGAIRAAAEAVAARKAGDQARAGRQETLAASYQAMRDHYQHQEQAFAQTMADRQQWEHATAGSRGLAIAADAELRRRRPDRNIDPLRSAEPSPASGTEREQVHLVSDEKLIETAARIRDLAAQHKALLAKIAERQELRVPRDDPGWGDIGEAYSSWNPRWDAILQPPKPAITPSATILQLAADHDAEPEAAD